MGISEQMENTNQIDDLIIYKGKRPAELLQLFKTTAIHVLKQKESYEIFKELAIYLTENEEKKLFESWEYLHTDPGEFYSIIHEFKDKYEENED